MAKKKRERTLILFVLNSHNSNKKREIQTTPPLKNSGVRGKERGKCLHMCLKEQIVLATSCSTILSGLSNPCGTTSRIKDGRNQVGLNHYCEMLGKQKPQLPC